MKRLLLIILTIVSCFMLSSCGRSVPIENLAITLILGIDLDENNQLIFAESSPQFNQDAKKNVETYVVKANSIRSSRKYFDALETGEVTPAKIQVFLIGKRILEHDNWFKILDTVFRNPIFSLNSIVLMVDGPMTDVILFEPEEKPLLSLHLKEVFENNKKRTRMPNATLEGLHRELYGTAQTAIIPIISKDKFVKTDGVALLDQKGKYVDSLSIHETSLLLLLRDEKDNELTLSVPIKSLGDGGIFHTDELGINIMNMKRKLKTKFEYGQFQFDFHLKMTVNIVERLFPLGDLNKHELEKLIAEHLEEQLNNLIIKIQKHNIDPLGLGIYASAYHYKEFKKVEDRWPEVAANAKININVDVRINSMGAVN